MAASCTFRPHNYWFLKKLKQYITRFYHHAFLFFMYNDLSFINTTQKTLKPSKKNVSISKVDEKKLHTLEFRVAAETWDASCFKKGLATYRHWKRYFFRTWLMLTYIHLTVPKILFILVLWDPSPPAKTFLKILCPAPPQAGGVGGGGVHAMLCQKFLKFWYWCPEKYFLLFIRFPVSSPST